MALILIKEDGTGKTDANAYAAAADGDAYHEGHLYSTAWTAATTGNKEKALVMATRLIDGQYQFNGFKANDSQALQWPRAKCPDPDRSGGPVLPWLPASMQFLESDAVPMAIIQATCEMARELLIGDRTGDPIGEGLKSTYMAGSGMSFDKGDRRPVISHVAQALLAKYGSLLREHSGTARLVRA